MTKSTNFSLSFNGAVRVAAGKPSLGEESSYFILTQQYYTYGTYKLFRTILMVNTCQLLARLMHVNFPCIEILKIKGTSMP